MKLFDLPEQQDLTYTTKVGIPQYLPSQEKPDILSLCDERKVLKLIDEINASNVSQEEKRFLIKAASRHYVFNYSRIADYYAHSGKEMQELMEKSALVLIDFDDAIVNGYVELSDFIKNLMESTGKYPALDDKLANAENQENVEDGDLEDQ